MQDVIDPGGVVQSQVVQSADGGLRIVLNASQSDRTQSARFVSELFGSGVQHIAFTTDDIFAAAERFRASGLEPPADPGELLRRPGGAHPTSPPGEIERLTASNILYDREGGAEFFQFYTQDSRGQVLLRDRGAARLQGFWGAERPDPDRGPDPPRAPSGHPAPVSSGGPATSERTQCDAARHCELRTGLTADPPG